MNPTNVRKGPVRSRAATVAVSLLLITGLPATAQQVSVPVASPTEEVLTLTPFSVTAKEDASGYGVTSSTTFSRLNTPLRDIPQTINIVTDKFIKELAAPTLGEALALLPGVSTRVGAPDRFQVRSIDVTSQFRNSFRFTQDASLDFEKDIVNIDRIEVIKGLGSATTGRGEAGGVINLITKKPQTKRATSLRGSIGSWGYNKTEVDTTGPLTASGSVLYRLIGSYTGGETFLANEKYDRFSFFPSMEFRFNGGETNLLIEGSLQTGRSPSTSGFSEPDWRQFFVRDSSGNPQLQEIDPRAEIVTKLLPQKFSQSTSFLKPDAQNYEILAQFSHKLTDWLSMRQGVVLFKAEVDREQTRTRDFGRFIFDPAKPSGFPIDWTVKVDWALDETDTEFVSNQGDFLLEYDFAGTTNETLFGYEYTRRDIFRRRSNARTAAVIPALDRTVINNLKKSDFPAMKVNSGSDREVTEIAAYVQHTTKLLGDRLQITGGWRYDEIREDIVDVRTQKLTLARPEPTADTWRAGASFRLFPWMTVYGLHATQTDPLETVFRYPKGNDGIASRDASELISTARGIGLNEFGIKSELFDGKITFNVSYYDIVETSNIRVVDFRTNPQNLVDPLFNWVENVIDPSSTASGLEFEVSGVLSERFSFYASAAFSDTELNAVQADRTILTQRRRGDAPTRLSFAGNYLVSKNAKWAFYAQTAFGYTGPDVLTNPGLSVVQSGSVRWDLGLRVLRRASRGGWEAQMRVQNLLDEYVITGTAGSGTMPRRFVFSLERHF